MGCDILLLTYFVNSLHFNPRTHVGCDFKGLVYSDDFFISIHAPTWGATLILLLTLSTLYISIHAPTWGATKRLNFAAMSTRISIHAPTWGATKRLNFAAMSTFISIHAPTWGATLPLAIVHRMLQFQSTHPRGVRQGHY